MYYQSWDEPNSISNGSNWTNLQGYIVSAPVAITTEWGFLYVFVLGLDRGLWFKYHDGNRWAPEGPYWFPLGGYFISSPAVVSRATEGIEIVGRGPGNVFWHGFLPSDGSGISWENLGGDFTSQASVVAWGPNRLDVVGRGQEGDFLWKYWNGTTWSSKWVSLGGDFASPPTLVSKQADRLSLYGIDRDGNLLHTWWDGKKWDNQWDNQRGSLGTTISLQQSPTAAGLKQRYDIFAVDKEGVLVHKVWTGSQYLPWEKLAKNVTSAPAVASWSENHLDVFALNSVKNVVHQAWDGKTWSPSISEADNLGGDFINFGEISTPPLQVQNSGAPLIEL